MKRKVTYLIFSVIIIVLGVVIFKMSDVKKDNTKVVSANLNLNLDCNSAILIEQDSQKILYKQNENEKFPMASMTKMMGLLLVCENIENGKINLTDEIYISANAASMGGSQVFLQENEKMTIDDLLKCVCIASANDAMYALSEIIAINNDAFIQMMNEKATSLNLKNTNFVNVTGFDDNNHYSSAYDMAFIARELLNHPNLILKYTSLYDDYIRKDSSSPFWLVNTNRMVKYYSGMDGLKTGYTSKSGFCLTATAKRNNIRLVSVIMGAKTSKDRNSMTSKLLDYGFSTIKSYKLFNANDVITKYSFSKAKKTEYELVTLKDISIVSTNPIDTSKIEKEIIMDKVTAPLKANDCVGKLIIRINDEEYEYPLYVKEDVETLNYFELLIKYIKQLI